MHYNNFDGLVSELASYFDLLDVNNDFVADGYSYYIKAPSIKKVELYSSLVVVVDKGINLSNYVFKGCLIICKNVELLKESNLKDCVIIGEYSDCENKNYYNIVNRSLYTNYVDVLDDVDFHLPKLSMAGWGLYDLLATIEDGYKSPGLKLSVAQLMLISRVEIKRLVKDKKRYSNQVLELTHDVGEGYSFRDCLLFLSNKEFNKDIDLSDVKFKGCVVIVDTPIMTYKSINSIMVCPNDVSLIDMERYPTFSWELSVLSNRVVRVVD